MINKAETQRRRARDNRDLAGFEPRPAFHPENWQVAPVLAIASGASFFFGLLYLVGGNTPVGFFLLILGAVVGKAIHDA